MAPASSRARSRSRSRGNEAIKKSSSSPSTSTPTSTSSSSSSRLWTSSNPSKRWAETFFLAYSPFWMTWALCIVVPFEIYERCDEWGYLAMGIAMALPCVLLPLLFPGKADANLPLRDRFWVKATVWISIFSHIGNYFWTHYFFELLGAEYTFKAHRLNGVPFALYLMTHAYFVFYHSLGNICIRAALRKFGKANNNTSKSKSKGKKNSSSPLSRFFDAHLRRPLVITLVVLPLSYFTAFMETATIAHFPHYRFRDRSKMYSVGSLFYAIYFFVSFPWFFAMDEEEEDEEQENEANGGERGRGGKEEKLKREKQQRWSLGRAATDALAAGMLVTILLDAWRLLFGGIVPVSELPARRLRLPWML